MLTWQQPHCQPFRDLLAHPKLVKYMNTMMGRGWSKSTTSPGHSLISSQADL